MKRNKRNEIAALEKVEKARPNVQIKAISPKQAPYIDDLNHTSVVIGIGSAGTGKTFVAASVAAQKLANREISRIVISRPNVPTGKSLGAFPGTVEEKMAPWLLSITNTLKKQLGIGFYEHAFKTGAIQIQPIETIRGISYDDSFLLFDESQLLVIPEVRAIVTRVGKNTTLVLMGDPSQRDGEGGGLEYLVELAERHHLPVAVHEFTSDDIVRSDICKLFVKAFEADDGSN